MYIMCQQQVSDDDDRLQDQLTTHRSITALDQCGMQLEWLANAILRPNQTISCEPV